MTLLLYNISRNENKSVKELHFVWNETSEPPEYLPSKSWCIAFYF